MKELFYQILRNALWLKGEMPESIDPIVFADIWQMAQEHCVSGLVIESMIRNNVKTNTQYTMKMLVEKQQHENFFKKFNKVAGELAEILNTAQIDYVIFKGQTLAVYYPEPAMRRPGDIDFYVSKKDFPRAVKIFTEHPEIKRGSEDTEKHLDFYLKGIDCEMHHRTETFGNPRHQRYFDNLIEQSMSRAGTIHLGDKEIKTLPTIETIILIFKHLYNHLIIEGVGLRQVCDLAILLHTFSGKYDTKLFQLHLKRIGYLKAFRAMAALLVTKLGLPAEDVPVILKKSDYVWGNRLLKEIERRGNFGKYHRKNMAPGIAKSMETAEIAFKHFIKFFPLAPNEMLHLIPQRIKITLGKYTN